MTDFLCAIGDRRATRAHVLFPWSGIWSADLELDEAGADIAGAVTVTLGALQLKGTVDPLHSGPWAEGRRVRVLGGAGQWSKALSPKGYHTDSGVRVSQVLQTTAAEAGETITLGSGVDAALGPDYVREQGAASAVFAGAAPGAVWWVDSSGVTQVATARPSVELAAGADLELLDFDALTRTAYLAGDPAAVQIGTVLRFPDRLTAPVVVRELAIVLDGDALRITAYETSTAAGGRLLDPFVELARRVRDERLPGVYRYRVVSMSDERVKLQAVTRGRWPDVLPCSLGAGIAGGWASLKPGAVILVAFEDEDRSRPFVISYTARGASGHVPPIAALDGDEVQLGDHEAAVHRVGDDEDAGTFAVGVPGALVWTGPGGETWTLTFVAAGSPVTVTVIPGTGTPGKLAGQAVTGSGKVKA